MSPYENGTVWCHNCGVEITWGPVRAWGRSYCCQPCLKGDPCECPGGQLVEEEGVVEDRRADAERVW